MKTVRFKDLLFRYRYTYIAGLVCLLVTDTAQLLVPRIIKEVIDSLVEKEGIVPAFFIRFFWILLGLACTVFLFRFLWRYFNIGTSWKISRDLRERLFLHLESLSPSFYRKTDPGTLMALMTNDIDAVRMSAGFGIVAMIDAAFMAVFSLAMMLMIDVRLTLLALIPMPLIAFLVMKFGKLLHKRFEAVQAAFAAISARAREVFYGIRVIKAFTLEESESGKFDRLSRDYLDRNMRLAWIWGNFFPAVIFLSHLSGLIILWVGGLRVIGDRITLGEFVAFNAYIGLLGWPMMAIGFVTNLYQRGKASLGRVNRVLAIEPDVADTSDAVPLGECRGSIEFRDLNFSYDGKEQPIPNEGESSVSEEGKSRVSGEGSRRTSEGEDRQVLRGVSFTIDPGETVGITGRIGSGKSTLVKLLSRLYEPPPGTVLLDGEDICRIRLKDLREAVSVIPQDPFLFSDTLGANIEFGDPSAPAKRAADLLKLVKLEGWIQERQLTYDTVVGEGSVTLSGGQRQRATIARGIMKASRILILDDVLSSVDTRTEEEILQALPTLISDRTTIIISHRVSALQTADRIVVLEEGRVAEDGTHEELRESGGYYSELCRKQKLARYGLK